MAESELVTLYHSRRQKKLRTVRTLGWKVEKTHCARFCGCWRRIPMLRTTLASQLCTAQRRRATLRPSGSTELCHFAPPPLRGEGQNGRACKLGLLGFFKELSWGNELGFLTYLIFLTVTALSVTADSGTPFGPWCQSQSLRRKLERTGWLPGLLYFNVHLLCQRYVIVVRCGCQVRSCSLV